jgi:hypothetical protein
MEIPSHPQTLHSESLYTRHPLHYTDPYILFLKSVMLFGRITDYTVRMGIRAPLMNHGKTDDSSPFYHGLSPNAQTTRFSHRATSPAVGGDPRDAPGFRSLDCLVAVDFINNFPPNYRSCLGVGDGADGSQLDTDLYMAHLVPHA